jgi:hypothetical protein
MMSQLQPDQNTALDRFHRFVNENCEHGILGGTFETASADNRFLPYTDLEKYFAVNEDDDEDRLNNLVKSVLPSMGPPAVAPRTIRSDYTKVFAILLCISEGRFIEQFVQHQDLSDSKLPLTERPKTFPYHPDFFESFCEKQWMFCAPRIRYERHKVWPARMILPIIHTDPIREGGSSDTYKAQVHPAYNALRATQPVLSPLCARRQRSSG